MISTATTTTTAVRVKLGRGQFVDELGLVVIAGIAATAADERGRLDGGRLGSYGVEDVVVFRQQSLKVVLVAPLSQLRRWYEFLSSALEFRLSILLILLLLHLPMVIALAIIHNKRG